MPNVSLSRRIENTDADTVFAHLTDLDSYPDIADGVQQVEVTWDADGGAATSDWEVKFRDGSLRWTERDLFDADARTYSFVQVAGDLVAFEGRWQVAIDGRDAVVSFDADFDLGMPSLATMLDPIATRALHDNIDELMTAISACVAVAS
ncbi:type II toxin-antitoxin system RatA family toxin [Nocardia sp. NPDC058640]|uniref:type II toxin-antitoxin system RatA family toxin n=1 Tax=Nocardia sp. NPDC058640 TaxID=3346571 RepID=UPI0036657756